MAKKLILLFIALSPFLGFAQPYAFTSAYGAGANTRGWANSPTILKVTTLNDNPSNPVSGEFRWAITRTYPRIIVFDVSGIIELNDWIVLGAANSDVYVAGQTSPNGIATRGYSYYTSSNSSDQIDNVVFRHFKFYGSQTKNRAPGDPSCGGAGCLRPLVQLQNINNAVFDHCDFVYNWNEAINFYANNGGDAGSYTLQNCIIGEGVTGVLMGGDTDGTTAGQGTSWHNLFVHISHRTPNFQFDMLGETINDVVYNWRARTNNIVSTANVNILGNYYKGGSASFPVIPSDTLDGKKRRIIVKYQTADVWMANDSTWSFMSQVAENGYNTDILTPSPPGSSVAADPQPNLSTYLRSTPVTLTEGRRPPVSTNADAYAYVLDNAGARYYLNADGTYDEVIDSKQSEYFNDVINGTNTNGLGSDYGFDRGIFTFPTIAENSRPGSYDTDNDGMADTWETNTFGDLTQTATGDFDSDGYMNIEEFLNLVDAGDEVSVGVPPANRPAITLTGNNPFNINLNDTYTEPGATWTDAEDGSGAATVGGDTVNTSIAGTYIVTYDHTDTDGNQAVTVTRTVNVIANPFTPTPTTRVNRKNIINN